MLEGLMTIKELEDKIKQLRVRETDKHRGIPKGDQLSAATCPYCIKIDVYNEVLDLFRE